MTRREMLAISAAAAAAGASRVAAAPTPSLAECLSEGLAEEFGPPGIWPYCIRWRRSCFHGLPGWGLRAAFRGIQRVTFVRFLEEWDRDQHLFLPVFDGTRAVTARAVAYSGPPLTWNLDAPWSGPDVGGEILFEGQGKWQLAVIAYTRDARHWVETAHMESEHRTNERLPGGWESQETA